MTAHATVSKPLFADASSDAAGGRVLSPFALDLRSLALFRLALAGLVVGVFADWAWRFVTAPEPAHVLAWPVAAQAVAMGVVGVAAAALLVGWASRLAALLALVGMVAVHGFVPETVTPGTTLLRLALLWATVLPIGERYAVDTAVRGSAWPGPRVATVATMGLVLQLLVVHLAPSAMGDDADLRSVTPLARALEAQPWWAASAAWVEATEALGFGMLVIAFAFSGGARAVAVTVMATLHAGLGVALDMGLLQLVLAAMWLALLPGVAWQWLRRGFWTPDRLRVRLWHSDRDTTQLARVRLLQTFLLLPTGAARPTSEDIDMDVFRRQRDSWVVTDASGYRYVKFRALAAAFGASPLFWPVGLVMRIGFVEAIGDWVYDLTKRRPGPVVRLAEQTRSRSASVWQAILAAVLLIAVLAWQLGLAERLAGEAAWWREPLRLVLGG